MEPAGQFNLGQLNLLTLCRAAEHIDDDQQSVQAQQISPQPPLAGQREEVEKPLRSRSNSPAPESSSENEHEACPEQMEQTQQPVSPSPSQYSTNLASAAQRPTSPAKRRHQCESCEKSFASSCGLRRHEKTHQETRQRFTCSFQGCGKSYVRQDACKAHEETHRTEFTCSQCNKKLSSSSDLKFHVQRHKAKMKEEKKYKCLNPECNKHFYTKKERYTHSKTHDPNKKVECLICKAVFKNPPSYKYHHKRMHAGQAQSWVMC